MTRFLANLPRLNLVVMIVITCCAMCISFAPSSATSGGWVQTYPVPDSLNPPNGNTGVEAFMPGKRVGHTAILDPIRNRMVVFGGRYQNGDYNDVWALSL